ncbi:PACE efflux transporter [Photobacterium ganghwense]|uniref:PACE efflux transporter n=1 Tax=Photobacterium ganghwense TaxID=320778 RepID=UPI001C2D0EE0|nr:PACE efflux transporter [Photobacterium ganghwense]MBV1842181.1 PACE efflux transporter [Photobacterium ganghwense]
MTLRERLFHAALFELLAIIFSVIGLMLLTEHSVSSLSGSMIAVAFIAMVWNMAFNAAFDRLVPGKRENRGWLLRIGHVAAFEGGLLLFTVPVMAWILQVSLWQAFILDIGVTLFITIYALIFNYCYDHSRAYLIRKGHYQPVTAY